MAKEKQKPDRVTTMQVSQKTLERVRILKAFVRARSYNEALEILINDYISHRAGHFKKFLEKPDMSEY